MIITFKTKVYLDIGVTYVAALLKVKKKIIFQMFKEAKCCPQFFLNEGGLLLVLELIHMQVEFSFKLGEQFCHLLL